MDNYLDKHTILIVDDSPESIDVLVSILKQDYKVKAATFGAKAIEIARSENPPDVILLDIVMADMNGYEICRQLKAINSTADIPVLFISVLDETLDKVKGFSVGGVDYITKPFQAEEVVARVKTHLTLRNMQKRLQEQTQTLQDMNRALKESFETLQLAQDQLIQAEKMAALGNLVAGVAHEINTPLGIGVTAASHLEQKTREFEKRYHGGEMTRKDLQHYLETAKESTIMILKNLLRAAEQIQSFKQVAVDQTSSEARRFKLREYLDDLLLSLHPKLKKTSHTVTVHCAEDLEVYSYPGVFSQILTNLILNSLLHGFEHTEQGEIVLDVRIEGELLCLNYHDNGKGISPEAKKHIFEPFYTSKRGQGSTGLGLNIVYNLVTQKLHGSIDCQSVPGEGITFIIQLPLSKNT